MQYVSIKDFASSHAVSYEAIRKSVVRYREELRGHIIRKDGCQYLDEEAAKFLEEHRRQYRVVEIRENQSESLKQKDQEIEELKKRIDFYRDELIQSQKQQIAFIEKQHECAAFLEDRDRLQAEHDQAITDREKAVAEAETAKSDRDQARSEAETAKAEAEAARTEAETAKAATAAAQADLDRIQSELKSVQAAKAEAETEANRYHKSWFGFYRKY